MAGNNGAADPPLVQNPAAPYRVEAPWQGRVPPDERMAFLLRVPTFADRSEFDHAVAAIGGRQHSEVDLIDIMADGIKQLTGEGSPDREAFLSVLSGYRERYLEAGRALFASFDEDEENQKNLMREHEGALKRPPLVHDIEATLHANGYHRLDYAIGDNVAYPKKVAEVAARKFLIGWENVRDADGEPMEFRRGINGAADECLARIPSRAVEAIAAAVLAMMEPQEARAKNSESPSIEATGQEPSMAASSTQKKTRRRRNKDGISTRSASVD